LSWLGFGSSTTANETELPDVEQLTIAEKAKLYDAIGYTDDEASYASYPQDYVNLKVNFLLKHFQITLIDGEYKTVDRPSWISETKIISLKLEKMHLMFDRRPVNNGFTVVSSVENILLTGCGSQSKVPILIEPQASQTLVIELMYDHKPIDNLCTNRFVLSSKALKLVYNSPTVVNISNFFKASIKLNRNKLKPVISPDDIRQFTPYCFLPG
jgi:hypothetical protein